MEQSTVPAANFFRGHPALFASLLLLGLFLFVLVRLDRLAPYDLAVYDWMQGYRSCRLDRLASFLRYWTTKPYATVALVMAVGGWLLYRGRWQDFGRLALIIIGGALLCELIKLLVSRPRPSALAFVDYGNSFPSGHVTSAVTIFGGAYYFLAKRLLSRWWHYAALGGTAALVLLIGFQRVYFTHHWASDALAGAMLGGAWLFFALDHYSFRVNRRSTLMMAALIAGAFAALRFFPAVRINGSTPMALRGAPLSFVDLTAYAPQTIKKTEESLAAGRAPETTWRFSQPSSTIALPPVEAGNYYLVFAARPTNALDTVSCRSISLFLNDRPLANLVIYNGWRDYRIALERDAMNAMDNRLTLNLGSGKENGVVLTTPALHARMAAR